MAGEIDPSLIQDFLTEAAELVEQLDADLVKLEHAKDKELSELLNGSFRALHTIKGAASFLALTPITTFAHAAEDALNQLRKGNLAITPAIMDAMLNSADVMRAMIIELGDGQTIHEAPQSLIQQLHDIAQQVDSVTSATAKACESTAEQVQSELPAGATRLVLGEQKLDLLPFMKADLNESVQKMTQVLAQATDRESLVEISQELCASAEDILKTADFFELDHLRQLFQVVAAAAGELPSLHQSQISEMLIRLHGVCHLTKLQADALEHSLSLAWPCELLLERISELADGHDLDAAITGAHQNNVIKLLELDGVLSVAAATADAAVTANVVQTQTPDMLQSAPSASEPPANNAKTSSPGEATVRVEVERLESLLNLVGQLVLSKNRFLSLSRKLRALPGAGELNAEMTDAVSDLDQLTSELQVGVMRTRMQPLGKLFDRYPRVIRDVARMTGKQIDLQVDGRNTEVDKSVLELLADPLVHILRNSADHGIESCQERLAVGKSAQGTIRLTAEHQGSHVRVEISDDGKGMDRQLIANKAVEKGMVKADEVEAMSDEQIFKFIFAAGFSTAQAVTDLSGRGVGMDVVQTNIVKMNGSVSIQSIAGKGTTVEILIPLTVAILPAMVVGVGAQLYALPLTSIVEIVRPQSGDMHSVAGKPVMRLRDSVLPVIDLHARLGETRGEATEVGQSSGFVVVVKIGNQQAGLSVDRLIGQQEVVIKPLDDRYAAGGPFIGATIREDGDVSLILDVIQLVRQSQGFAKTERTAA